MAPEKAIVISTHILEEVDAVCTRAIIIAAGRVVADATPADAGDRCIRPGKLDDVFRAADDAGSRDDDPRTAQRGEAATHAQHPRSSPAANCAAYFATPVATVFIVIFLVLQGALTFNLGDFFDRGQADLNPFFTFIPWVFLLLVPAITMRLWAEERRLGTIELLLTLPITQAQAVIGKFLAAWAFCAIALVLTFPFVITVNILGSPDNGVIASGYVGALLVAGAFLVGRLGDVGADPQPGDRLRAGGRGVLRLRRRVLSAGHRFPVAQHARCWPTSPGASR